MEESVSYKCNIKGCKMKNPFQSEVLLSRHFKTAHSSINFSCYLCERKCADRAVLLMHLNLSHKIEEPDKRRISIVNGSNPEIIGYLEVEERNEVLDESNGILISNAANIFSHEEYFEIIETDTMMPIQEYSSVPNKHAARLLIFRKKFLPTSSIWSYTFIKFQEIYFPTWLFGPTHILISDVY